MSLRKIVSLITLSLFIVSCGNKKSNGGDVASESNKKDTTTLSDPSEVEFLAEDENVQEFGRLVAGTIRMQELVKTSRTQVEYRLQLAFLCDSTEVLMKEYGKSRLQTKTLREIEDKLTQSYIDQGCRENQYQVITPPAGKTIRMASDEMSAVIDESLQSLEKLIAGVYRIRGKIDF